MTAPRVLAGRYRLEGLIGRGGMGKVFRARDLVLERTVAVKVLAAHLAEDEAAVARFRREALAAARLNHPAVVTVFDTGSENGWPYLVMEHVEGRTLSVVLAERGALPAEEAAAVGARLASALAAAHDAGIVHRDVKPSNVIVTPDGDVKMMDFGIARAASAEGSASTAAVLGTAAYISPEQALGRPVDHRSDLYSLGAVLYELSTGRPPFVADSPLAVVYRHVEEAPMVPSTINPQVPEDLEAVVLRALAKDPAERYTSAEALGADLEAIAAGVAVTVASPAEAPTDVSPVERSAWSRRRRRWRAVAAAVGAAIALWLALAIAVPGGVGEDAPILGELEASRPQPRTSTGTGPEAEEDRGDRSPGPTATPEKRAPENAEGPQGDVPVEEEDETGPSPEPSPSASPSPTPTPTSTPGLEGDG